MTRSTGGGLAHRVGAALAAAAASAALCLTGASVASAAPAPLPTAAHAPFTCSPGKVILATYGNVGTTPEFTDTQLYTGTFGQGTISFTPLGTPSDHWNATGYNPVDGYFYGVGDGSDLLQIGADGSVTDLGALSEAIDTPIIGAFDDAGDFWVPKGGKLYRIDVTTRNAIPVTLSGPVGAADLTYSAGYLWGMGTERPSPMLHRVDPSTGDVATFPVVGAPDLGSLVGGAFTYGNGNLGFYSQASSTLMRVAVSNPTSTNPTARLISTQSGPTMSGWSDAASCFEPASVTGVDLQVTVDAPATVPPNTAIDYTVTVHNNGPGDSSGWTVTDTLPANLTGATVSTSGCSISAGVLSCTGGALASGGDAVIHFTGTAPSSGTVVDPATVYGNEADPNPNNNHDSASTDVGSSSGGASVDLQVTVDAPPAVPPTSTIDYTVTVHNNGPDDSTGWTVTDTLPANLTGATVSTSGCSISAGVLTCTGGPLVSGGDAVIHFTGTAPSSGTVLDPATVTGNEPDPNSANDHDSATTQVAVTPGAPMISVGAVGAVGGGALLAFGGVLLIRRRRRGITQRGV